MIVYVIIVGPVLYAILRFYKKRDYYWLAVPAASFVGVMLIAFAGRGFEVESTRVYSVTMYNLAASFDLFTSYEDRGRQFKQAVNNLSTNKH